MKNVYISFQIPRSYLKNSSRRWISYRQTRGQTPGLLWGAHASYSSLLEPRHLHPKPWVPNEHFWQVPYTCLYPVSWSVGISSDSLSLCSSPFFGKLVADVIYVQKFLWYRNGLSLLSRSLSEKTKSEDISMEETCFHRSLPLLIWSMYHLLIWLKHIGTYLHIFTTDKAWFVSALSHLTVAWKGC